MGRFRLLDVRGHEWRYCAFRRTLRLDHQPQFQGPAGARRAHPSHVAGDGGGRGGDRPFDGCARPPAGPDLTERKMERFKTIETPAVPLPLANIDTDQLIPARFMKRRRSAVYGPFRLYDFRNGPAGPVADNPLDDPRRAGAAVMIARRNFGCGSS